MSIELEQLRNERFDYVKTEWHDKVTDPEGDVSHPGVPFTARRANNLEQGVEKAHARLNHIVSYLDEMTNIQKQLRLEFLLLKSSVTSGLTSNIFVENFRTLDDISLVHGTHDPTNHKVYLP